MKKQLSCLIAMLVVAGTLTTAHGQNASSLVPYSDGIDAKSTSFSKYVSLNDTLSGYMLATKNGLRIVGNDQFQINTNYPVKDYLVVSDYDNKGSKDIVVYLESPDTQNNVMLISSEDSEVLFAKNYTHLNAKDDGAQFEENASILQMLYANEKIYILYDYHIVCLDVQGNEIFDYEDSNNIWKMVATDEGNIIFTTQTGMVKTIDGTTGKKVWSQQVAGKVEVPTVEAGVNDSVQLNAWDIYINKEIIYVTLEDGSLLQLDKASGNVVNNINLGFVPTEQMIRNLSSNMDYGYGQPTIKQSGITTTSFMGYTLEPLKEDLLLVNGYLGHEKRKSATESTNGESVLPKLGIYEISSGELKTTFTLDKYNLKTSNAVLSTYQDQEVLIIPSYSQKGVLKVNIYTMDGTLLAQENIKVPAIKDKDEMIKITKVEDRYLIQSEGNVTFYVSLDFKTVEYVGNLSMASLIAQSDGGMLVGYSESGVVNKIKKLNNGNKEDVVFEVNLPEQFVNQSNGFEAIRYDEKTNELLMLINKRNNNNEVEASYIMIINATDGSITTNDSVVLDKGVDEQGKAYTRYVTGEKIQNFKDLNNDGQNELLVDNAIIDRKSMTLKAGYSTTVEDTGLTIEVGDVNGDEISDFILFGETQANLYYSKASGYEISYSKSGIKLEYAKDLQNNITAMQLPDFNHDGIHDVVINARNSTNYQVYRVIDGANLATKYDLMSEGVYNWGESFELPGIDYNQDGTDDIIYNTPFGEVAIIDGSNGKTLQEHNLYPVYGSHSRQTPTAQESVIPIKIDPSTNKAALIEDQNGDGKKDVAYLSTDLDQFNVEKNYLTLVDSVNFAEIKKIQLLTARSLNQFDLISVEGQKKVLYYNDNNVQIFDYEKESNLAGFQTTITYAKGIDEEHLIIADNENNLYRLNDGLDFTLTNKEEVSKSGQMTFEWSSDKSGKMSITDGGMVIATTAENKTTVKLLEGEHQVQFSYDDGHGKVTHQTQHITVKKSHALNYVFNGGLVLVIGLAAGLLLYPKYRLNKKAGVKRG